VVQRWTLVSSDSYAAVHQKNAACPELNLLYTVGYRQLLTVIDSYGPASRAAPTYSALNVPDRTAPSIRGPLVRCVLLYIMARFDRLDTVRLQG